MYRALCPASRLDHGTLSANEQDVRCGVTGMIRDAEGSPCCGEYVMCPIWRGEKERTWALGRHRSSKGDMAINAGTGQWTRQ